MKKYLFLGLAALGLMTACTKDETIVVNPSNEITFENAFVDKSTRATDLTTANLSEFAVFGYMTSAEGVVFNGNRVYKSNGSWKYDNPVYWTEGKDYWFTAIAPYQSSNWKYNVNAAPAAGLITLDNHANAAKGEDDLIVAQASVTNVTPSTQGAIAFTFDHLLSRVKFSIKNEFTSPTVKLKITDIAIDNATDKGVYDLSAKTWNVARETTSSLSFGVITDIASNATVSSAHKYLLPSVGGAPFTITLTVEMYNGTELAATYKHSNIELGALNLGKGKSYNITAGLNAENINPNPDGALKPIEFTVTEVKTWADFSDEKNTIPTTPTE